MKKDIESRLRRLEQRKVQVTKSDDALTYELKHMDVDRLTNILIGSRVVSDAERQKIKRFAVACSANPNSQIDEEFMDLPFVKAYMDKTGKRI